MIFGHKQENVGHSASEEAEAMAAAKRQESIRLSLFVVSKATYYNCRYMCALAGAGQSSWLNQLHERLMTTPSCL